MSRLTGQLPPVAPASVTPISTAEAPAPASQQAAVTSPHLVDSSNFTTASPKDVAMKFYEAFTKKDPATMESLYAEDVHFKDIIFDERGKGDAMHLWRTLMKNPTIEGTPEFIKQEGETAYVKVKVKYVFSQTKRPVEREFIAKVVVRDGKIVSHLEKGEPGKGDFDHFAKQAFWHGWMASVPFVGDLYEKKIVEKARDAIDAAPR